MTRLIYFLLSIIIVGFCFSLPPDANAQRLNNTAFRFLNLPTSARSAALGGNHITLNDAGIGLFQQNPAYLTSDQHRQFAASYINHLADVKMGFFNGGYHLPGYGTAALGIRYVNYGNIEKKDARGRNIGTFTPSELALTLGLGRKGGNHFRYGVSVEFIYSSIDIYQSTGLGLNLGALYTRPDIEFSAGATLTHLGYQTSAYRSRHLSLPLNLSVALTKRLKHTPLRISIMGTKLQQWPRPIATDRESPGFGEDLMRHLVFGGEFIISSNVYLRVGYNYFKHQQLQTKERLDLAGFSYGIGITIQDIQFDFSRKSYSEIGGLTQLSLQTDL